jgi:hypothetical protein
MAINGYFVKIYANLLAIMEDASEYCHWVQAENVEELATGSLQGEDEQQKEEKQKQEESSLEAAGKSCQQASPQKTSLKAVEGIDPENKSHSRRSNKTHQSTSDPDGRITRKPGKPTDLYYRGHISVDSGEGIIVAAMADYGDREDHERLPQLIEQADNHLNKHQLRAQELVADSKYNTSRSIEACRQAGITPYMPNPSGYKREREGFTYDEETDSYQCSEGVELPFRRTKKNHGGKYTNKIYQSAPSDCKNCPLREACLSPKANQKKPKRAPSGKALYDQMDDRLQTEKGKRLITGRKGIVKLVFGNLLHHYGMRKVYARGKPAAGKHVTMAATAYNLKKWLKKSASGPFGVAVAAEKPRMERIAA